MHSDYPYLTLSHFFPSRTTQSTSRVNESRRVAGKVHPQLLIEADAASGQRQHHRVRAVRRDLKHVRAVDHLRQQRL